MKTEAYPKFKLLKYGMSSGSGSYMSGKVNEIDVFE